MSVYKVPIKVDGTLENEVINGSCSTDTVYSRIVNELLMHWQFLNYEYLNHEYYELLNYEYMTQTQQIWLK